MKTAIILLSLAAAALAGVPWIPEPRDQAWVDRHNGFVNNSLINGDNINVLFYGDSITDAWRSTGLPVFNEHFAPLGAANYGIGGDRTEHVLWRIINGEITNLSPKLCVLKIGTNNLGANTNSDIARGISAIVDTLRSELPDMKILLLGILPRNNADLTTRCENINEMVSILDNGNTVRYLNMRDAYYRGDGQFFEELYTSDLLHLSGPGYVKWQEVMNTLFTEMYGSELYF